MVYKRYNFVEAVTLLDIVTFDRINISNHKSFTPTLTTLNNSSHPHKPINKYQTTDWKWRQKVTRYNPTLKNEWWRCYNERKRRCTVSGTSERSVDAGLRALTAAVVVEVDATCQLFASRRSLEQSQTAPESIERDKTPDDCSSNQARSVFAPRRRGPQITTVGKSVWSHTHTHTHIQTHKVLCCPRLLSEPIRRPEQASVRQFVGRRGLSLRPSTSERDERECDLTRHPAEAASWVAPAAEVDLAARRGTRGPAPHRLRPLTANNSRRSGQ